MSLLIRPALADDVEALALLVGARAPAVTEGYVAAHPVFAGTEGERLVGFYALEEAGRWWTMPHLCVAPEWRGRGRGRWLFTDAVRRILSTGPATLHLVPEPESRGFFLRMSATAVEGGLELRTSSGEEPLPDSVGEAAGW